MGFIINESAFTTSVSKQKKKDLGVIEFIACLQEANKVNRNGRIYKKEILQQAIMAPAIQEKLAQNNWYMEAGHPADCSVQRQMTIDQHNICGLIKEVWWEGDLLMGRIETANTAVGRDFAGLIEQGSTVSFSLRAQGNVHQDPVTGYTIVEAPINIVCFDWVCTPSHKPAIIQSICESTKNAMFYNGRFSGSKEQMLCEAMDLYTNGELIPTGIESNVSEDYTKTYHINFKKLSEMYIPESGDEVKTITDKEVVLENQTTHTTKRVLTEDYLVKDIRSKILGLNKEEK